MRRALTITLSAAALAIVASASIAHGQTAISPIAPPYLATAPSGGGTMTGAEILAALLPVDGTTSTLDADLFDGANSSAYCLVAGGNAFAASNTYAANDITDADVVDTLTCSNYLPLAGGTMTGGITSSAVATDVTTGTDEDYTIAPNGTGVIVASKKITMLQTSGVTPAYTFTGATTFGLMHDGTYMSIIGNGSSQLSTNGYGANLPAGARVYTGSGLALLHANLTVSTATSPTAGFVRVSSAGAVAWTPGTTVSWSLQNGTMLYACNVDAESDVITITDGSTYEGAGTALGINDCVMAMYDGTTTKWRQISHEDN